LESKREEIRHYGPHHLLRMKWEGKDEEGSNRGVSKDAAESVGLGVGESVDSANSCMAYGIAENIEIIAR
jgi:hypothetical protein